MSEKKISMTRAALYIRVSTEEQAMHGYSLEAQREALTRYAKEHDLLIVDYYVDEGKSARGKMQNRKEFMRMLEDVKADKIDLILFIKLDRWFRSVKDYYKIQEILETHHVNWCTTEEHYDTTTTNGRLHINIRLSIAQDEADRTSDRIKFVFASKLACKEVITGMFPPGFKVENKHLVHDPKTIDMVRDLFHHYETHGSKHAAIEYIFRTYGVELDRHNFSKMIANPLYKGEYRGIKDYCEPIIEPAVWDKLNAIVNVHKPRTGRIYIFSGLVTCGECGYRMAGRHSFSSPGGVEHVYYRCNRYSNLKDCTNCKMINEVTLETWLLENIEDEINSYILQCQAKAAKKPKPKINRSAIKRKLARLKDLYINEMIDMETYKADYEMYTAQLAEVQEPEEPTADIGALQDFLNSDFKAVYEGLSREKRRIVWRSVIKDIKVDAQKRITISFT